MEQGEPLAGEKEEGKEDAPVAPWGLTDLFTDDAGANPLKEKGYTIGGWSTWGYSSNNDGAFTGNGPFNTGGDEGHFNAKQQYLYLEKKADTKKDFDWGYRGDVMYGVDGYEGQSFGNNFGRFDFSPQFQKGTYAWAIPQLYGEVAFKDVSIKLGHFFTHTGYEVIPPAGNFFYSHQITWYNAEAFYHTGALATWTVNDKLTLVGGWVLGWDTGFDQLRGGSTGMFGLAYTISEKTVLSMFSGFGNQGWRGEGSLTGFILSHKWTDRFTTVQQLDVFNSDNPTTFTNDGIARESFSYLTYLYYDLTKDQKWRAGFRQELWRADSITYQTLTVGINYKPHPNVIIRPELRYLYAPGANNATGALAGNVQSIYANNAVFGFDMVFLF